MSTEDTKQTTPTATAEVTKQETTQEPTLKVNHLGEEFELPLSRAKAFIEKRDKQVNEWKSLKATQEQTEKQKNDAIAKAELMERLKNESYEAIKADLSKETNEKLGKYHAAFVERELKAELASHPDFIGGTAIEDAVKLLQSSTSFSLDDSLVAKTNDGKSAKEVVDAFVKSKDVFRKAKVAAGTGVQPKSTTVHKGQDVNTRFRAGIEKIFKK